MSYHSAKCDQADQSIRGKQAQAHDDGVLERLQTVLLLACVDHEQKNRGRRCRSRQSIFDGGTVGVELGGHGILRDVLVMRRQRVSLKTERTDPEACSHIDLATLLSASGVILTPRTTHQNGLRTARHGCLHETGSYCNSGMSSLPFNGVYSAPIGTNQVSMFDMNTNQAIPTNKPRCFLDTVSIPPMYQSTEGRHTMRELGKVFQLRRMPSLSSISLHCSLSVS
jgi:hypothetical protein